MRKTTKILTGLLVITVLLSIGSYFIPTGKTEKPQKIAFRQIALTPKDVTLSIAGDDKANIGESIKIAIDLKNTLTSQVAALEFVLNYDKDVFSEPMVRETPVLKQVQKEAVSNLSEEEGTVKVVIFGLNQNAIRDGKIIEITLKIKPEATPTQTSIAINEVVAATPDAKAVSVLAKSKDINII